MSSKQTEPDVKSCGVLVFREDPVLSFLLMKHSDRWDLPKGHIDDGESEMETALRELFEETAITESDIEIDPEFQFRLRYTVQKKRYGKEPMEKELVVFLGTLNREVELVLTEHIGFEWFEWNPPHAIQPKSIDPLLQAVHAYWRENS